MLAFRCMRPYLASLFPAIWTVVGLPPLSLFTPLLVLDPGPARHTDWDGDFNQRREAVLRWGAHGRTAEYPVVRALAWHCYGREAVFRKSLINRCGIVSCCNLEHWVLDSTGEHRRITVYSEIG